MFTPSYVTRRYTLEANIPVPMPPGTGFTVMACSVDEDGLSIALGDDNDVFAEWFPGVAVFSDIPTVARLKSTQAQTVLVNICIDGTRTDDNSVPVYNIGGYQPYSNSGNAAGNFPIIAAVSNQWGILITELWGCVRATGALTANTRITADTPALATILGMAVTSGDISPVPFQLNHPVIVPPGIAITLRNVNATTYVVNMSYKFLNR